MATTIPFSYLCEYLTPTEIYFLTGPIMYKEKMDINDVFIRTHTMWDYCETFCSAKMALFEQCIQHAGWSMYTTKYQAILPQIFYCSTYKIINILSGAQRPIAFLEYYLGQKKYNCQRVRYIITQNGNLTMLRWLSRAPKIARVCRDSSFETAGTARAGHINILRWQRNPYTGGGRYGWNETSCWVAVMYNQLPVLKWMRNPFTGGGVCPWDKNVCLMEAKKRELDVMVAWIQTQPA